MANFAVTLSDTTISVAVGENTAAAAASATSAAASAAAAEAVARPIYASTAAGLAATSEGDFFFVDQSDGTADLFRHDAGPVATAMGRSIIIDPQASGASGLVGHIASGSGAVARTVQSKLRETASAEDFGAVSNGTTDDSTAMANAVAAKSNVTGGAGSNLSVADIALTDHDSFIGGNSLVNAASGAANIFSLSGFNSRVKDFYISAATNASQSAIRIAESRYAMAQGVIAVNCGPGFINLSADTPASQAVALPTVSDCHAEGVTGTGMFIGSSVSELHLTNFHIYGQLVPSGGALRPSFTSVGWRQNTPQVGGFAVGGHLVANANMIDFGVGWHLTDASLSSYTNCIADGCASYGVLIDGASQFVKFADLFVGTTRGIRVEGSSSVWFDGLVTVLNGVIPPWGSTDFYNGVTTFYDLEVLGTATVRVSNWKGDKRINVAPTARLTIDDGIRYSFRTIGTVGAGATGYLAEWGNTLNEEDCAWRAPCAGHIVGFYVAPTAAPGAAQSFTYTVRKNGSGTTLTGQITGASTFELEQWCGVNPIPVSRGDRFAMELVTSAGAAASYHNGSLLFLPE